MVRYDFSLKPRTPRSDVLLRHRSTDGEPTLLQVSREEARFLGEHDRLNTVAEVELLEDVRDVRLDGRVRPAPADAHRASMRKSKAKPGGRVNRPPGGR
jgi:hypothetical protein